METQPDSPVLVETQLVFCRLPNAINYENAVGYDKFESVSPEKITGGEQWIQSHICIAS